MNWLLVIAIAFSVISIACAINATRHARDARRHADAAIKRGRELIAMLEKKGHR